MTSLPLQEVTPVILSGGAGARLWPVSTPAAPKQFHALISPKTMIQETAERLPGAAAAAGLGVGSPYVICSGDHGAQAQAQLQESGISPRAVVLEPVGRNTAAAAAVASLVAAADMGDALLLLLPSDHLISDPDAFARAVALAAPAAQSRICVFGVRPTRPETGYGYIERGEHLSEGVFTVARFAEKPDEATAAAYVAGGDHLWNAGIFLFRADVMLAEMERWRPDILAAAKQAVDRASRDGSTVDLDRESFAACPSEALDRAVMEKTSAGAVVPCDMGWTDVGSWSELWRLGPLDAAGNRLQGRSVAVDTSGSLVWSSGRVVATLGVSDLVVVETPDAVIVLHKDRAQDVRSVVEQVARLKAEEGR